MKEVVFQASIFRCKLPVSFREGIIIIFSIDSNQLVVNWWFGLVWILGIPENERDWDS